MTGAERRYSVREREALGVVFALLKFRDYVLSTDPFVLWTDQQALKALFARKDVRGRPARLLYFLEE